MHGRFAQKFVSVQTLQSTGRYLAATQSGDAVRLSRHDIIVVLHVLI